MPADPVCEAGVCLRGGQQEVGGHQQLQERQPNPVCESGVCQRGRNWEEASVRISVGLSGFGQDPRTVSSRVTSLTCLLDGESFWIDGQVVAALWAPAHLLGGGKN